MRVRGVLEIAKKNGGGTFRTLPHFKPYRGTEWFKEEDYATGYYVGVNKLTTTDDLTESAIEYWAQRWELWNDALLRFWLDTETGLWHIDIVMWAEELDRAKQYGEYYNEKAIWDIKNEKEIRL